MDSTKLLEMCRKTGEETPLEALQKGDIVVTRVIHSQDALRREGRWGEKYGAAEGDTARQVLSRGCVTYILTSLFIVCTPCECRRWSQRG